MVQSLCVNFFLYVLAARNWIFSKKGVTQIVSAAPRKFIVFFLFAPFEVMP